MTTKKPESVSLYKQMDQALSPDSSFKFHCHGGLSCFNQCCRTPTILLSPYDIFRLQQALGVSSQEFLEKYTRREFDQWSNLPLVFIDAYRTEEPSCPFLGDRGCKVYAHRPAACRLFPITMGSQLTEQGVVDYYFCRRLDYCRGLAGEREWTLESWIEDQGFAEYHQGRQEWLEILLMRGLEGPQGVEAQLQDLFATISYDLDQFRQNLTDPQVRRLAADAGIDLTVLQTDDLALLRFSYRYLRSLLF